jgi:hypothetical protein
VLIHAHISKAIVRAHVREHTDFKYVRGLYFSRSLNLQYHTLDPREGNVVLSANIYHGNLTRPLEDVHKMLDRLFVAMEEGTRHRGALRFPQVQPAPSRSGAVAKSLAMLSRMLYIPSTGRNNTELSFT